MNSCRKEVGGDGSGEKPQKVTLAGMLMSSSALSSLGGAQGGTVQLVVGRLPIVRNLVDRGSW
jgi:hypothetical protein